MINLNVPEKIVKYLILSEEYYKNKKINDNCELYRLIFCYLSLII